MQSMCSRLKFSFPAREWDCVITSYSVKGRQSSWFVCSKTWSNCVGCNVSEIFSSPRCNTQLFHLYFFNNRDCKYNNVSVTSSYYYLLVALFEPVCSMKKYSCVGLFVGASTHLVQVYLCGWWDHAVTASGDEYLLRNLSSFNFFGKKRKQATLVLIIPQEAFPGGR